MTDLNINPESLEVKGPTSEASAEAPPQMPPPVAPTARDPKAMAFGKRVQKRRKKLGLTLAQLAKEAGCSAGYVHQIEAGILPVKMNKGAIARVKQVLKVRARGIKSPAPMRTKRTRPAVTTDKDLGLVRILALLLNSIRKLDRTISKGKAVAA